MDDREKLMNLLCDAMIMKTTLSGLERLHRHGYRCIHLFGNVYLVRNYSVNARRFSLYGLVAVREGE